MSDDPVPPYLSTLLQRNTSMKLLRGICTALTFLVVAAPGLRGQGAMESTTCIVVHGLSQVSVQSGCDPWNEHTIMITLTGTLEVDLGGLANVAIVSCWVCEGGTCGTGGPYGPSRWEAEFASPPAGATTLDWAVPVKFADDALGDPGTVFPELASYACRLELEVRSRSVEVPSAPATVPGPYAAHVHARTQEGQPLVVELQGTLADPVTNTRR